MSRVTLGSMTVVVKRARSAEMAFYKTVAPGVRAAGVGVPELLWSMDLGDASWIVLEDIPAPLPKERWLADPAVMVALRRLHRAELPPPPDPPGMFRPRWSDAMTDGALAALPARRRARLKPILRRLQQAAAGLFAPRVPISGDPNPTNWGLRADGTVVLYDWERSSRATAAIDLAITIPGFPAPDDYRRVAETYLGDGPDGAAGAVGELADRIAIAKVWNVVEHLSMITDGSLRASPRIQEVASSASDWLLGP
ncbi:MAG: aminoglycoside phosphotransferase family protein [Chloroflexota bacterium]|nr:aminoglycoside phosphotransferase family protein [Chloroflexota bacterium]